MSERLTSDYATQSASIGPHPLRLWREKHGSREVLAARQLKNLPSGCPVLVAGTANFRQSPGMAKGPCFISPEDETGIANLFVPQKTFQPFLRAVGRLQRSEGNQPTMYVTGIEPLADTDRKAASKSHDFHQILEATNSEVAKAPLPESPY